jgi:hypothetical protein
VRASLETAILTPLWSVGPLYDYCCATELSRWSNFGEFYVSSPEFRTNHNIKTANGSFANVTEFSYLGKIVTNQNWFHEEIKSRLNLANTCYHSSHLLSKNINIKIYRTIILPVVLYGCDTSSLILRGIWEQGAEENIWIQEGWNDRRVEKIAWGGAS